jgi:zinc protease
MDLIGSLGFSPTSDLYQRLVVKEQKVDALVASFDDRLDPYLLTVMARVKNPKDTEYVKGEILKTFDSFKTAKVPKEKLEAVKSNLKYSFALSLNNTEAIAASLASYIALRRTPEAINKVYGVYATVTPEDIQEMAKKYFVQDHRTIVTLSHKEKS